MIDHYMALRSIEKELLVDPNYTPDQAVLGYLDSGPEDSQRLAVIFPPWHTHLDSPVFSKLTDGLASKGFIVRRYDFNDHILEPNLSRVLDSYRNIQRTVVADLELITKKRPFKQVHLIGASIGAVSLGVVADKFTGFTRATIVAGSGNLAFSTWHGERTKKLRQMLEEQGVTAESLSASWYDLGLINYSRAFKGKPVRVIRSKTDTYVLAEDQINMVKTLSESGANVFEQTTMFGHHICIGSYCLFRNLP